MYKSNAISEFELKIKLTNANNVKLKCDWKRSLQKVALWYEVKSCWKDTKPNQNFKIWVSLWGLIIICSEKMFFLSGRKGNKESKGRVVKSALKVCFKKCNLEEVGKIITVWKNVKCLTAWSLILTGKIDMCQMNICLQLFIIDGRHVLAKSNILLAPSCWSVLVGWFIRNKFKYCSEPACFIILKSIQIIMYGK